MGLWNWLGVRTRRAHRPIVVAFDWHTLPRDGIPFGNATAATRADARAVILHARPSCCTDPHAPTHRACVGRFAHTRSPLQSGDQLQDQGCAFVSSRCAVRAHPQDPILRANESATILCARQWKTLYSESADTTMCAPTICSIGSLAPASPLSPPISRGGSPPSPGQTTPSFASDVSQHGERCDSECFAGHCTDTVQPEQADVGRQCLPLPIAQLLGEVSAAGVKFVRPSYMQGACVWAVLLLLLLGPTMGLFCTVLKVQSDVFSREHQRTLWLAVLAHTIPRVWEQFTAFSTGACGCDEPEHSELCRWHRLCCSLVPLPRAHQQAMGLHHSRDGR